jgi:hypothetical protein
MTRAIATRRNERGFPEPAYLNAPERKRGDMAEWKAGRSARADRAFVRSGSSLLRSLAAGALQSLRRGER